jgi:hypothetical protein
MCFNSNVEANECDEKAFVAIQHKNKRIESTQLADLSCKARGKPGSGTHRLRNSALKRLSLSGLGVET